MDRRKPGIVTGVSTGFLLSVPLNELNEAEASRKSSWRNWHLSWGSKDDWDSGGDGIIGKKTAWTKALRDSTTWFYVGGYMRFLTGMGGKGQWKYCQALGYDRSYVDMLMVRGSHWLYKGREYKSSLFSSSLSTEPSSEHMWVRKGMFEGWDLRKQIFYAVCWHKVYVWGAYFQGQFFLLYKIIFLLIILTIYLFWKFRKYGREEGAKLCTCHSISWWGLWSYVIA